MEHQNHPENAKTTEKICTSIQTTENTEWRKIITQLVIKNATSSADDFSSEIIKAIQGAIPAVSKTPRIIHSDKRRIVIDDIDPNDGYNILTIIKTISTAWFCYSRGTRLVDEKSPMNDVMFRFPLRCEAYRPENHENHDLVEIKFINPDPDSAYVMRDDGSPRIMMKEERDHVLEHFAKECVIDLCCQFSKITTQRQLQLTN